MNKHLWKVTAAALVLILGGTSLAREAQPGDDHGGHGGHHAKVSASPQREAQPGDDHGGRGHDDGPGHH